MDSALDSFRALPAVVPAEDVRMRGAWAGKPQRRYASQQQSGTGEGPYIETVDWRWDGAFEGASPLVGLALLSLGKRLYWVKSHPPTVQPAVGFSAHGWAAHPGSVSVTGSFHGAYLPSMPINISNEPPASCVMGPLEGRTGTPHVVMRLDELVFAVVLFPASAIKVGRNRLWHLREGLASHLPPNLQRLLTRGRSGEVPPATR
jgi:hypothetical protein